MSFLDEYKAALAASHRAAAEVERLDEERRIVFSHAVVAAGDVAVAKAEHIARASDAYQGVCDALSKARHVAADARAKAEYLQVSFEQWRTQSANARRREQEDRDHA